MKVSAKPDDTYSTWGAKTKLSEILDRVSKGDEILITKHGRPIAKVVPVAESGRERKLGELAGTMVLHPGWDDPISDVELLGD